MNFQSPHTELSYGLFELDARACVVRYAPAFEQSPGVKSESIVGHDFFTEVVSATEIKDCQARFRLFMENGLITDKFSTTFPSAQGPIKVQMMLAQIIEKSERGTERFALVRLMPDEGAV